MGPSGAEEKRCTATLPKAGSNSGYLDDTGGAEDMVIAKTGFMMDALLECRVLQDEGTRAEADCVDEER
jgi:hypothetical protein